MSSEPARLTAADTDQLVSPPGIVVNSFGYTIIELVWTLVVLGILAAIAIPKVQENIERARVGKAIGDIRALAADVDGWTAGHGNEAPESLAEVGRAGYLDPWGNPYVYVKFEVLPNGQVNPGSARKDRFLVPLNSTYDLYSMGKDGATATALTAAASKDDVIRANDGGYIGLAKNY